MISRKLNYLIGLALVFFSLFVSTQKAQAYGIERLEVTASVLTDTAEPRDDVVVNIDITKNPGICGLKFDINYDDMLVLKKVTLNQNFEPYITSPQPFSQGQIISYVSPYQECKQVGNLATLTFTVKDDVTENGIADIVLDYYMGDIFDQDLKNVPVYMKDGQVKISTVYMNDLITLEEKDNILTATIDSDYAIVEWGMLSADTEENITLETPGRIRVGFDDLSAENAFSLDISGQKNRTYRAYFIMNLDGKNIVRYSNIINSN